MTGLSETGNGEDTDTKISQDRYEGRFLGELVAEKEEGGRAKGIFGPELLPSQVEGRSRCEGGRERPASGQAPA